MLLSDPVLQELNWRLVAEGRMLPFPVVEDFDVLEAGGFHVGMSGVANPMHPLIFEAVEPTLRRRVIPAVPFPAHRAGHAEHQSSIGDRPRFVNGTESDAFDPLR